MNNLPLQSRVLAVAVFLLTGGAALAGSQDVTAITFPEVRQGSTAKARVEIVNSGDSPMRIQNIELSCSCARVEKAPQNVEPGATGEILLAYDATKAGPTELTMLVQTDQASDPVLEFRWSGNVAAAVVPLPENVDAYYASADEINAAANAGRLYDIRPPEDFAICHIAKAQNRPLPVLSAMPLTPGEAIVLYGSGANDDPILRFAASHAGQLQLKVLVGGLRHAKSSGLGLTGAAAVTALPMMVKPSDFHASQDKWVVVELAAGGPSMPPVPGSTKLDIKSPTLAGRLKSLAAANRGKEILVISSLGEGYDTLEKILREDAAAHPFYLDGGLKAYHEYLAVLEARGRSREITLVSKSGPMDAGTIRRKPCGTCP